MNKTWWAILLIVPFVCLAEAPGQAPIKEQTSECLDDSASSNQKHDIPYASFEEWEKAELKRSKVSPDRTSFITVEELKPLTESGNAVLVDVRKPESFAAIRMPDTINIAGNNLVSKSFLKHKTVVLIDDGFAVSKLQTLAKRLRSKAYSDVRILAGGLLAWRNANEELVGNPLEQKRLGYITPRELFLERRFNDVVVLDVSGSGSNSAVDGRSQQIKEFLLKQAESIDLNNSRIVITDDQSQDYDRIERVISELEWPPVFYLEGGTQAYRHYLKSQWAIWNRPAEKQGITNTCGRRKR